MSDEIDEQFDAQTLKAGTDLFNKPIEFVKGVVSAKGLPEPAVPEIAFAGRSNVGKSSLINALTGRKNLARTSNTPGRTREINFFSIDELAYLVDMPGYGYAKVPKQMVDGWTDLIKAYLRGRVSLKRTFLLIDSRRGIKANDIEVMKTLDTAAVIYQIVFTKIDKISVSEFQTVFDAGVKIISKHPAAYPHILATSSAKRRGIEELKASAAMAVALG